MREREREREREIDEERERGKYLKVWNKKYYIGLESCYNTITNL